MNIPSHFPEQPKELWNYFHAINQIPRPSRKEEKMREYIEKEANSLNLKTHTDEVGNIIVYVPASAGYENHETVIIQNHMDMVTDATPDRQINFNTDPIVTFREGDWIKADRTTLGADNGIGCAAAMALMHKSDIAHPALELLFTMDEETGLKGAWGVDANFLKGKKMINLDTEEWGSLYIGCAGGIDYEFKKSVTLTASQMKTGLKLIVGGFLGGHSGVDIHEQRGNAIKFLMDWLNTMPADSFELNEWRGGKAHNIIPRDCFAYVNVKDQKVAESALEKVTARWKSFMPVSDQSFFGTIEKQDSHFEEVLTSTEKASVMGFLSAFPHGAHAYDLASNKELVALSNNLAITLLVRGQFYLETSLRFFDRGECIGLENQVTALGNAFAMDISKNGEYPSWKPVRENKLLDLFAVKYEELFKKKAKVTAIHAGLECGILRDKIGPIDAVSFGPTIMGAHSPQERVLVPTVEHFWDLLKAVLKSL